MRLCAKNLFSDCFLAEAFISRVSAPLVSKAKKTGEGGEKRQFHNQEGLISIWLRPFSNLPTNEFLKKTTTAATCYYCCETETEIGGSRRSLQKITSSNSWGDTSI